MNLQTNVTDDRAARRAAFDTRIREHGTAPLWEVFKGLAPNEPTAKGAPHVWRYDTLRPFVLEMSDLVSGEEAEIRSLVLENPALKGQSKVLDTLYAAVQSVLPGEVVHAHRHVHTAVRMVIESKGAYSIVDGEKAVLHPGDFLVTPPWLWHGHGNETDEPAWWLDGIDLPQVLFYTAQFRDEFPGERYEPTKPAGDAIARFGSALLPVTFSKGSTGSPLFVYPFDRTREALAQLARGDEMDTAHGHRLRFADPTTGGWVSRTLATWMQLLPAGFEGKVHRSTESVVFKAIEGAGRVRVSERDGAETEIEFGRDDIFCIPAWRGYRFDCAEDVVLYGYSDRAAQEALGVYREAAA